ncbi:MAG: amidohydrolase [Armatimonadota bacterium]
MTIYLQARVHSHGDSVVSAHALAVAGERLLAVGTDDELIAAFPRARRVDLMGFSVFPGLIDAHNHFVSYGLGVLQVELREARSIADAVRVIAAAAADRSPDTWVLGRGWDKNLWVEGRFPSRHDLDPATGARPAAMTSKDGHLLWVNSAALQAAGVSRETPDPPGGAIGRDSSGEPDGLLKEEARLLVQRVVPSASPEMREQAIVAASADFHRLGLTGVHAFTGATTEGPDQLVALQRLHARRKLAMRTVVTLPDRHLDAAVAAGMCTGLGDEMLRVGPVKIFADGTLGSQTASMLEPFHDQPDNVGIEIRTPEEIDRLVRQAVGAGLWTAIHAIGDRANHDVLDIFERHLPASQRVGARHRIEHVQLLHPDDLPRLGRLGVTASMQPIHATADRDIADRYWGQRSRWAYAWRSLAASGAVLAFGSDAPVETPDPWRGLYAAVTRRREDENRPSWYPQECVMLSEAIRAYTAGAAHASGTDAWQGTLESGKVADFIVVDRDPFAGSPRDLLDLRVWATFVGGHAVHATGPLSGLHLQEER